ncbi:MAG: hypothetical protein OYG31_01540 [Candidatus Kaiserbacteria bacterium]|nr:hypothetical protein [Candidatus Kaiserbacteria bacterium]
MGMIDNRYKTAALIVLSGVLGFFLGGIAVYSAVRQKSEEPIVLHPMPNRVSPMGERVFVSTRGRRFYPWWCESAIKEENRVWFTTPEEAAAAGYTIAKACGS